MEANPILFRDLTYIFLAAVFGGLVAWRLRLPLILGFIFGGIVISPFTPGPHLSDLHTFEVFAEVGVVLLMFSIGVEFSIPDLMRVKWVALVGAPIGILVMVGIAVTAAKLVGWSSTEGVVIGATISVASTMVLARLLSDTGQPGYNLWACHDRHHSRGRPRRHLHDRNPSCTWRIGRWPLRKGSVDPGQGIDSARSAGLPGDQK